MFKIMMFSGSSRPPSNIEKAMTKYVRRSVQKAIDYDYVIMVGDNPSGVDLAVLSAATELGGHVMVASPAKNGAYLTPRSFRALDGERNIKSLFNFSQYHERDRSMVEMSNAAMFIWDGSSKGTLMAWKYMTEKHQTNMEKDAWLVNFGMRNPETGEYPYIIHKRIEIRG